MMWRCGGAVLSDTCPCDGADRVYEGMGGRLEVLELTPGVDLLHSMRSVGYSFETAVADLVDNSITAGATRVEVQVDVVEGKWVAISDDGQGMTPGEATEALRLAGTARTTAESTESLGRFGLGLKTASLSQGRRLDVVTCREGVLTGLAWDIDRVAEEARWVVEVLDDDAMAALPQVSPLVSGKDGTTVVWSKLDYLIGKAANVSDHLSRKIETLRFHLGLVFHRFLEGKGALQLILNGRRIEPIDPFLTSHLQTQRTPEQSITIQDSQVLLQGYTLPHARNLPPDVSARADMGNGLKENQGFYIYRNRRLIFRGGWFGLRGKDELTKQARVRVDITDALDYLWQVDIRKARSEPPSEFREKVRPLMDRLVVRSENLHTRRARSVNPTIHHHYWNKIRTRDGIRFEVNPQHPVVRELSERLDGKGRALFSDLLDDLAACFPYYDTYVAAAKNELPEDAGLTLSEVRGRLVKLRDSGFSRGEVAEFVDNVEPFKNFAKLNTVMEEVWADA